MTTLEKIQLLAEMQQKVNELKRSGSFTKKDLCEACAPVRDLMGLTDRETIMVANNTATLSEIVELLQKTPDAVTDEKLRAERIAAYQKFFIEFRSRFPHSEVDLYAVNAIKKSLIEEEGKV